MNTSPAQSGTVNNVIDLFSRQVRTDPDEKKFIRIAPELDGLAMVYSHPSDPSTLFSLRLIGWGMQKNGRITGIVPWLQEVISAEDACDPKGGQWQGYYDYESETVFSEPPEHKIAELEKSIEVYEFIPDEERYVMQAVPDITGTHIVSLMEEERSFQLAEVHSWSLYSDGSIEAMLVDEDKVTNTPVLPGDDCLYPVSDVKQISYYFQYQIANQIKRREPEAMQALLRMMHKTGIA
ncbi:hypothetical protein [Oceanospirillum sediminis]|uniref:Uncharacterized protein n=1 Tax=Oceanospirillum sediminis TaxID=2760088 RepID=A0A839ILF9_9GAMM|nr:hypothetical protein [Oceanospirillum sediminis]MBB1486055.1 hypothetical protein [Oceanospirillum sediminis]